MITDLLGEIVESHLAPGARLKIRSVYFHELHCIATAEFLDDCVCANGEMMRIGQMTRFDITDTRIPTKVGDSRSGATVVPDSSS